MPLPLRYPGADYIGDTPNRTDGAMSADPYGIALHIQEGYEAGSEAWFKNPQSQASSHLLNPKSGKMRQMVEFDDKAWAEAAGNPYWISIENEGFQGEALTESQLSNIVNFYLWARSQDQDSFPLQLTDDVNKRGIGWHGMGGAAWGGHYNCPGEPIKNQRQEIINRCVGAPGVIQRPPVVLAPWPGRYLSYNPDHYDSDVKKFQQRMIDRKWYGIGSADGKFGPKTLTVVRQFQTEKHLLVDGVVGPDTWNTAFRTDNVT